MSTTITSLLNSLHTHLQSQTQLLPTLHAQLGLPPTALTDELTTLQQQLTQCIESQIDLRRKQVDEWMGRCAEVESQCIRYGNALGGHVKATGGSVGEIRKEQVLPRRFEIISEYQEKLRQVRITHSNEPPWDYGGYMRSCALRTLLRSSPAVVPFRRLRKHTFVLCADICYFSALPHEIRTALDPDRPSHHTIKYPWSRLLLSRRTGPHTSSRRGRVRLLVTSRCDP